MKKILLALTAISLFMSSCTKENEFMDDTNKFSKSDFEYSSFAEIQTGPKSNSFRKSNLKIAIRKVQNAENKYRLALKVDSLTMNIDGTDYPVNIPSNANITAGLSIPNPNNADVDLILFEKNELNFTKENENGFAIYVSSPFVSNYSFDYELVKISLNITTNFAILLGKPLNFNETESHLILPNGKAIVQSPALEKLVVNKKNNGDVKNVLLTISGDPVQKVSYIIYKPDAIVGDDPNVINQLPGITFDKTFVNKNNGIARFECYNRWDDNYGDGKTPSNWKGSGTIYAMDNNDNPIFISAVGGSNSILD